MKQIKKITLIVVVISIFLISACSQQESEELAFIHKTLETKDNVKYLNPMLNLKQDHTFQFDMKKNLKQLVKDKGNQTRDIFQVYVDKELKNEIPFEYDLEGSKITVSAADDELQGSTKEIMITGDGNWGLFDYYYLVQKIDLETGKKLKKPLVTIFTMKQEMESPKISYQFDKDKNLNLSWNKVDTAKKYAVVRVNFSKFNDAKSEVLLTTTKTSWSSKDIKDNQSMESLLFKTYETTNDGQYANIEDYWWSKDEPIIDGDSMLAIVAINGDKISKVKTSKDIDKLSKTATCDVSEKAMGEIAYVEQVESMQGLPSTIPASDCEGKTVYRKIELDVKAAKVEGDLLRVPYAIADSTFKRTFTISSYDAETYKEELKIRNDELKEAFKAIEDKEYKYMDNRNIAGDVYYSDKMPKIEDPIFSNSPLEEYITKNMIDGAHMIELASYDYSDEDHIYDLIGEVINQNPIILNVKNYVVYNSVIYIDYHNRNDIRYEQQKMIREKVSGVVSQIITPEMNDVQKVYAINKYILDSVSYHHESYEATMANDGRLQYQYFDGQNAKGALIDGLAVCEGYAHLFDLLAAEAGLPSVVITGQILGQETEGGHAWNRVEVNGQWYVVDTTTNDSEDIPNTILNLSDEEANILLQQDERAMLDGDVASYSANNNDAEYYRSIENYVSKDAAVNAYVTRLSTQRDVTLKIELSTTKDQLENIFHEVFNQMNKSMTMVSINGVMRITLK